ncbi:hypothetical protein MLD38_000180 [Melastoma candidum]|uniref:Uncharacterized protein n=1 Tax=Melastoma candidum TaxID=119954 RepID=A0ACB9S977_9MYRT|nr:hypothetical protein MLD38_000180 [Melastoma candidum]
MAEESTRLGDACVPRKDDEIPQKRKVTLIGQFQKLEPPKFKGDEGPKVAEDFISELEKIFNILDVLLRRICLWSSILFKEVRRRGGKRALEFTNSKQGMMTVDEYEGKFAALSHYGPNMKAESKARKFELGLDPEIRLQVAPLMLTSYEEIYRRAQNTEKALMKVKAKGEAESSKRMMGSGLPI